MEKSEVENESRPVKRFGKMYQFTQFSAKEHSHAARPGGAKSVCNHTAPPKF